MLLLVVGLIVTGVVVGRVLHSGRYVHEVPLGHRELRVAPGDLVVRYGALETARFPAAQELWVRPLGDGRVAVFAGRESARVLGFVSEGELGPRSPRDP